MNTNKNFKPLTFKKGVKDGLPIGLGYFPVSLAFGVTASALSVPVFISIIMSMTNLTSAGQLAGLKIIAIGGSFLQIIFTQLVINSRYFLMSVSLSQKVENVSTIKRMLMSAGITDEIFGVAVSKKEPLTPKYFFGLILCPYIGWVLGTVVGACLGNVLPLVVVNSLGIALYSMFIAIFSNPAIKNKKLGFVVLISTALSCLIYFVPTLNKLLTGVASIVAALIASIIAALLFPVKMEGENG
ncbi:MAG: AzlC family ABC transporter permease [Clostridia bacterium]|nr:AzlC family ABC transporter permease [Clostridia bacterium]